MKSFKYARLAVAVALAACGAMGGMVASQRTGAAMAKNAQAFLDSLTPGSGAEPDGADAAVRTLTALRSFTGVTRLAIAPASPVSAAVAQW